jgi:hypothetical protein
MSSYRSRQPSLFSLLRNGKFKKSRCMEAFILFCHGSCFSSPMIHNLSCPCRWKKQSATVRSLQSSPPSRLLHFPHMMKRHFFRLIIFGRPIGRIVSLADVVLRQIAACYHGRYLSVVLGLGCVSKAESKSAEGGLKSCELHLRSSHK